VTEYWKWAAVVGWAAFVLLAGWHFVIEPLQVQVSGLTNVVQQLVQPKNRSQLPGGGPPP
jgi:hypothetical protein